MTSPTSQPAKDNKSKLNPFLYFHLVLMAIAPWLLVMTMAGLAVGDPLLPTWLEILLLGLPAIALPTWWQWQQPFSPFSLWLAAKPKESLSDRDRKMLALLKQKTNGWYVTGWMAIAVAVVMGIVFSKLYDLAPLAQAIAPFADGWRFFGVIYAEVCLFLSSIVLQSGISALRLYLVTEPELDMVQPIAIDQIKNSFTSLNLLPASIATPLLKLFDTNESVPNHQELVEPPQTLIQESQSEVLPVLEIEEPTPTEIPAEPILEPLHISIPEVAKALLDNIDNAVSDASLDASPDADKLIVEIPDAIADLEISDNEIEPEQIVNESSKESNEDLSEELIAEVLETNEIEPEQIVDEFIEESTVLETNEIEPERIVDEFIEEQVTESIEVDEVAPEQVVDEVIDSSITSEVHEIESEQVVEDFTEESIVESDEVAPAQIIDEVIDSSINLEVHEVEPEQIVDEFVEESIVEIVETHEIESEQIVEDFIDKSVVDIVENPENSEVEPEYLAENIATESNEGLTEDIDALERQDSEPDKNADIKISQSLDLPVTNPSTTAAKPKSFLFDIAHKSRKLKSKTQGFGKTVKQETVAISMKDIVEDAVEEYLDESTVFDSYIENDVAVEDAVEEELDERAVLDNFVENVLYDYFAEPSEDQIERTSAQDVEVNQLPESTPAMAPERKPNKYLVEEFLMDKFFAKLEKLNSSDRQNSFDNSIPLDEVSSEVKEEPAVSDQKPEFDEFDELEALLDRDQTSLE